MALIKQFTAGETVTEPLVQAGPGLVPKSPSSGLGDIGEALTKEGTRRKIRNENEAKAKKLLVEKSRRNMDTLATVRANGIYDLARLQILADNTKFDNKEDRIENLNKVYDEADTRIASLDISAEAKNKLTLELTTKREFEEGLVFLAGVKEEKEQVLSATTANYITAISNSESDDDITVTESLIKMIETFDDNGVPDTEMNEAIKKATAAGDKQREQRTTDGVYAAIELATAVGGDFENAKELAKNPIIPENKQATLRSAIETAKGKQEARRNEDIRLAKSEATSTAIRESYQGTLTVADLDKRHAAGLIADSAYTKMRDGLASKIPATSDRVARSTVNRKLTDFKQGAASKEETEAVFMEAYPLLDEADRKKFDNDIEIVYNKGVETSKSEAKSRGAALISQRFKGILDGFKLDNAEDIKQFDLEWQLRNIYEDSIDDWVAQQVAKGTDPTPRQVRVMANDLLVDFKNIKAGEKFEGNVLELNRRLKSNKITGVKPLTKPVTKPVKELTTEEIRAKIRRLESKK